MKNLNIKIIMLLLSFIITGLGLVYAANYYTLNSGTSIKVDEHGICKQVTNNSSNDYFLPTNTSTELTAFVNNTPSGVSLTNCTTSTTPPSAYTSMVSTTNYIEVLNDILFKWEEEGAGYAPFSYSGPYNDNSTYNYANVRMASSKYFEGSVKVRGQTGIWSGGTIFRLTPYTNSYDIANSIVFYIAKDQIPGLDQTRIGNTSNCAHTNIEGLTWLSGGCGSTTIFGYSTSKTLTQYTYIPNGETLACPSGYTETGLTGDKACKK